MADSFSLSVDLDARLLRVFSFGGGVQSTAALVLAARGEIDCPTFLFANVGEDSENPDTIAYVERHARPFAASRGIAFHEIRRQRRDGSTPTLLGELLREDIRAINIPVRMANGAPGNRNCTETFKIKVVSRWLKEHGVTAQSPAVVALGISLDEFQRARTSSGSPLYTLSYPLIEKRLDRSACHAIIESAGLPVPPKSSCWFCPLRRSGDWQRMREEKPEQFQHAVELEKTLNARRHMLGKDDVYLSSAARPLEKATSPHRQGSFFDEGDTCESGYCMT